MHKLIVLLTIFLGLQPSVNAQDFSSLTGTWNVEFVPLQTAGIRQGCSLVFGLITLDAAYRQGKPVVLNGNITYLVSPEKSNAALSLKLTTADFPNKTRYLPFSAYIQTPSANTAKSVVAQRPDESGYMIYVYKTDIETTKVILEILEGKPITLGFNRINGGLDVLASLDLSVVSTTEEAGQLTRKRSTKTLDEFRDCLTQVTRALKQ